LAFIEGRHGISTWFADYVEKSGPDLKAILRYRGLAANMEEIRRGAQDAETSRLYRDGRRTATDSAMTWFRRAHDFSKRQEHAWVGLRHLMGAVIFTPNLHADQLGEWRFDRALWAAAFLDYVHKELPEDYEFWKRVDEEVFGQNRRQRSSQIPRSGDVGDFSKSSVEQT